MTIFPYHIKTLHVMSDVFLSVLLWISIWQGDNITAWTLFAIYTWTAIAYGTYGWIKKRKSQ